MRESIVRRGCDCCRPRSLEMGPRWRARAGSLSLKDGNSREPEKQCEEVAGTEFSESREPAACGRTGRPSGLGSSSFVPPPPSSSACSGPPEDEGVLSTSPALFESLVHPPHVHITLTEALTCFVLLAFSLRLALSWTVSVAKTLRHQPC